MSRKQPVEGTAEPTAEPEEPGERLMLFHKIELNAEII